MLLTDNLLLDYKRCQRRAFLEVCGEVAQKEAEREFLLKLRRENQKQVEEILAHQMYQKPSFSRGDWQEGTRQTQQLMAQGVELIHRGVLWVSESEELGIRGTPLLGKPTLLVKQPGVSKFGNWAYSPVNVKLGKRPKPEYKVIAAFHAYLLAQIQGILPKNPLLVLRQQKRYGVDLHNWLPRMKTVAINCYQMLLSEMEPDVFISRQRCGLCQWHTHCRAIARNLNHLSLVPGVTPSRYQQLQQLGVTSLAALATESSEEIDEVLGDEIAFQLQQQARSIVENRAFFRENDRALSAIPTAEVEFYFDIEAEPDRNLDFLLGVLVVNRRDKTEQFYPFLAEHPDEEALIWQQFLALTERYPQAPIFHYSEYEVDTVKRLARQYPTPNHSLQPLLSRFVDLHAWVTATATLPVESYSLKSLAQWLGFEWRDRDASGDRTVCWYDRWLHSGDRALLDAILRYNEDDCRATYCLKDWLVDFLANTSNENSPISATPK
ncbi:TM0106 family RecB-like putative nuclease [Lusitaniella coriacea LEGE 07157]|uniref:TM0106 family RecB-like putative nuclease n=1 Tax=Lusitaniella coriacea LEGE 07157 TaxID=945747 RepID=A0A8J7DY79_9CYAN|nr:TM0106 family RecB-like putative nuclease [Lusitaniella coriacea]MBE9117639.1 TM0106 family RecB-like putative nuclease [Lusitaniella coriacea LEGE 07157]